MPLPLKLEILEQFADGGFTLRISSAMGNVVHTFSHADILQGVQNGKSEKVQLELPVKPLPSPKLMKRKTMKQEERVAASMGGHRQKGSGALPWRKGDGCVKGKYRIENKMRFGALSYTLKREELNKIRSECDPGETPLFQVDFADRGGHVEDSWILVPYEHWVKVHAAGDNK